MKRVVLLISLILLTGCTLESEHSETSSAPIDDEVAPSITLSGEQSISVCINETFVDPSVTYSDNYDQEPVLVTRNEVDILNPGTYKIYYQVKDSSDNLSAELSRDVTVEYCIPELTLIEVIPDLQSVFLDYEMIDKSGISNLVKLELLLDGEVVLLLDDIHHFEYNLDPLYSNSTYQVDLTYSYEINGEETELVNSSSFTTLSYTPVNVEMIDTICGVDFIDFSIVFDDVDRLGYLNNYKVYLETELIHSEEIVMNSGLHYKIENLFSNSEYHFVFSYSYDMNDGNGLVIDKTEFDFYTEGHSIPSVNQEIEHIGYNDFTFNTLITDSSQVIDSIIIELIDEGNVVGVIDNPEVMQGLMFQELLTDHDYILRTIYQFNLDDRAGDITIIEDEIIRTNQLPSPVMDVNIVESGYDVVSFEVNITDEFDLLTNISITLMDNNDVIETIINPDDFSNLIFDNLLSNHNYWINVTYEFEKPSIIGVIEENILDTLEIGNYPGQFKTLEYQLPTFYLEEVVITANSISFDVDYDMDYDHMDAEIIVSVDYIEIRNGENSESLVPEFDGPILFDDLFANTEYSIFMQLKYNMHDGLGNQTIIVPILSETTLKTVALSEPNINIPITIETTQYTLDFPLEVIDDDSVIVGDFVIALYDGEILIEEETIVVVLMPSNMSITYDNLMSNVEYTIVVTTTIDLQDGFDAFNISKTWTVTTDAKEIPSTELNTRGGEDYIDVKVDLNDVDLTIKQFKIELILDDVVLETIYDTEIYTFADLTATTYTVKLILEYDLNDGDGWQSLELSKEEEPDAAPSIQSDIMINQITHTTTTVEFSLNINISQTDGDIQDDILTVSLYDNGVEISVITVDLINGTTEGLVFNDLDPDTEYQIVVSGLFDMNDGFGYCEYRFSSANFRTDMGEI